MLIEKLHWN